MIKLVDRRLSAGIVLAALLWPPGAQAGKPRAEEPDAAIANATASTARVSPGQISTNELGVRRPPIQNALPASSDMTRAAAGSSLVSTARDAGPAVANDASMTRRSSREASFVHADARQATVAGDLLLSRDTTGAAADGRARVASLTQRDALENAAAVPGAAIATATRTTNVATSVDSGARAFSKVGLLNSEKPQLSRTVSGLSIATNEVRAAAVNVAPKELFDRARFSRLQVRSASPERFGPVAADDRLATVPKSAPARRK